MRNQREWIDVTYGQEPVLWERAERRRKPHRNRALDWAETVATWGLVVTAALVLAAVFL